MSVKKHLPHTAQRLDKLREVRMIVHNCGQNSEPVVRGRYSFRDDRSHSLTTSGSSRKPMIFPS